jgi:hypothetical protein
MEYAGHLNTASRQDVINEDKWMQWWFVPYHRYRRKEMFYNL